MGIKAGDAALRALAVLIQRLGIDGSDVVDALHEAQQLGVAVGALARRYPEIGAELADLLASAGSQELADSLRSLSKKMELDK